MGQCQDHNTEIISYLIFYAINEDKPKLGKSHIKVFESKSRLSN